MTENFHSKMRYPLNDAFSLDKLAWKSTLIKLPAVSG